MSDIDKRSGLGELDGEEGAKRISIFTGKQKSVHQEKSRRSILGTYNLDVILFL